MTQAALAVIEPKELVRQSSDIAGLCKEIVVKTAKKIGDRQFVPVEGWQSIATAHGCVPTITKVEHVPGGIVAVAELIRMADGASISRAEGFVGDDEATWANRSEYARRAMAQTRAMSRVCRTCFAHVVVLMDAGLETTPLEEMPLHETDDVPPRTKSYRDNLRERAANMKGEDVGTLSGWQDVAIHFGKNKGKKLGALTKDSLEWYYDFMSKKDPNSLKAPDRKLLAALAMAVGKVEPMPSTDTGEGGTQEEVLPMFNGGAHEELHNRMQMDGIEVPDVLEALKKTRQIPEDATGFDAISNELAETIINDYPAFLALVKGGK